MKRVLAAAVEGIATAAVAVSRVLTGVMLAVLALQVFMRSALNKPPSWSEEVALLAFSWAVLLAIAYGVRESIHVRMEILLDLLPARVRGLFERAVLGVVAFVGLFLLYAGFHYVVESAGSTSAAIGYPMPLLYASTVTCGFLIAVFALERMLMPPRPTAHAEALP